MYFIRNHVTLRSLLNTPFYASASSFLIYSFVLFLVSTFVSTFMPSSPNNDMTSLIMSVKKFMHWSSAVSGMYSRICIPGMLSSKLLKVTGFPAFSFQLYQNSSLFAMSLLKCSLQDVGQKLSYPFPDHMYLVLFLKVKYYGSHPLTPSQPFFS